MIIVTLLPLRGFVAGAFAAVLAEAFVDVLPDEEEALPEDEADALAEVLLEVALDVLPDDELPEELEDGLAAEVLEEAFPEELVDALPDALVDVLDPHPATANAVTATNATSVDARFGVLVNTNTIHSFSRTIKDSFAPERMGKGPPPYGVQAARLSSIPR